MSQTQEIESIEERIISLNLSDADVIRISKRAGYAGLTVSELLENFIGDLVCGTYSNGSDERYLANRWFERCGFSWVNGDTFLSYLINCDDVEDTVIDWNEIIYYKKFDVLDDDDKATLEELEDNMNEKFTDFQENLPLGKDEVLLADEMERVLKWWAEYEQMLG